MHLFSKKKNYIFIVSNSLWSIHNFRSELIYALKKKEYKVIIISFGNKNEKKFSKIKGKILQLDEFSLIFFFSSLKLFFYFLKYRPKYVLTFTHIPNIICSFYSIIFRFNQISNLAWGGADTLPKFYKKILIFFLKFSFKISKKTFFQNQDDLFLFTGKKNIDNSTFEVLPGSGLPRYSFLKNNIPHNLKKEINIINVSRLIPTKGLIYFCEAAKIIKTKHNLNLNFFIQSSFKSEKELSNFEKTIFNYHNKKYVQILPFKRDLKKLYRDMDIAVCTSVREGTPRFLIEAISCGLPIISSNVPGCTEICINNYNGYLFNYGEVNDLVKKILKLINLNTFQLTKFKNNSYRLFFHKYEINYVLNSYLRNIK